MANIVTILQILKIKKTTSKLTIIIKRFGNFFFNSISFESLEEM